MREFDLERLKHHPHEKNGGPMIGVRQRMHYDQVGHKATCELQDGLVLIGCCFKELIQPGQFEPLVLFWIGTGAFFDDIFDGLVAIEI